ncbi:MAG: choice-of-anchor V domain-containing protein [Saprospiraceae bacterium]
MYNKKFHLIYVLLSGYLLLSYVANPPNGYTGAPGDSNCSSCHSPGGSGGMDGSISISGLPSSIMVNTTYNIVVTIENLNTAAKGGFQMVVLDQTNSNSGVLSGAGASSTIQSGGGRTYFEHNPALNFVGPGTVSYTVNWKSPTIALGQTVTMYAAAILANGNTNSSNDLMKLDDVSGTMPGPPPLNALITGFTNVVCNSGFDGSISVTATNGVPPYSYAWSDGQTTATAIGLGAKMYTVTVSDNIGGSVVQSKLLTEPPAINIVSTGKKALSCNGDKDGSININSSGGVGIHSYKWNTGVITKNIANLTAGEYTVTVTDASSCTQTSSIFITQPDPLVVTIKNQTNPVCINETDGSCSIEVDGGTVSYKYKWSSGETSSSISNKKAGTFTVTVTDANNCTKSKSVSFVVTDVIKPVFNHWKDSTSYRCNLRATIPQVSDNCAIKEVKLLEGIQVGDTFPIGITKMRYKAVDENSNETEYTYFVTILNPLKLHVDTFTYDVCFGKINLLKLKLKNLSNQFYDLYFDKKKISRFDSTKVLVYNQFNFSDSIISIRDSFNCSVDTVLLFDSLQEGFILETALVKDASFCNVNDGEIKLTLKGKILSFKWLDDNGNLVPNQTGKDLSAGRYYYLASAGVSGDSLACMVKFGPFDVKCTTANQDLKKFTMNVYPNPVKEELYVDWNSDIAEGLVTIYSLNGNLISSTKDYLPNQKIILSDLENGIYILQLELNGFKQRSKIYIAR